MSKRYNGKCKKCSKMSSVLASFDGTLIRDVTTGGWRENYTGADGHLLAFDNGQIKLWCACGSVVRASPVRGIVNRKVKCDARCTEAKGHSCECACGGKYHGAGHEVAA